MQLSPPSTIPHTEEFRRQRGEIETRIRLQLFNNTRGAISIKTHQFYLPPLSRGFVLSDGRGVLAMISGANVFPHYIVEASDTEHAVEDPRTEPKSENRLHVYSQFEFPFYKRLQLRHGHLGSISWIASGESVFFTVPLEHLDPSYLLSISFNYEWEKITRSVRHWVTFSGDGLWEVIGNIAVQE